MLKIARQAARFTQAQLATAAGVDPATISRLESGRRCRRPSYEAIIRISRALNVAPDVLFPVPPLPRRRGRPTTRRRRA